MKEEALKLADELDETPFIFTKFQASAMIRKLVAELDNLEVLLDNEKTANGFLNDELDKQGEPVAWMHPKDKSIIAYAPEPDLIPLYTAPQTKEEK